MSKCLLALFAFLLIGYMPAISQERGAATSPDLVASAKAFVELLAS